MKVRASVKKICRNCKIVKRNGVIRSFVAQIQDINRDKDNEFDFCIAMVILARLLLKTSSINLRINKRIEL
ncbi:MAG: hypothetical protein CM15mP51_03990 [Porticoccaceae bacterium]|nr:MAG: hypothetical protein CM15mP51_03990 [Porticoccaceae bacterium]